MARIGYARTREELQNTVRCILEKDQMPNPFTNNRPGKDRYYAFRRRHPDLSLRKPERIGKERAVVTEEAISKWFDELEQYMATEVENDEDILRDPTRIFNADESGFPSCIQSGRILAQTCEKTVYGVASSNKQEMNRRISLIHWRLETKLWLTVASR